ncbi:YjgN family protein [Rhodoferax aquaticus]|uniref:DUF898 domain-containing protein n=1 Tax=Rhodoferax aquaticus TaxID=2527691 RepID=A0A515ER10_9BURK|nr:YjgN family protein [Rhodoferax aquaticus]QDL55070.1 DUF898 domain-containing protein [Rhodoferax aquaticus]
MNVASMSQSDVPGMAHSPLQRPVQLPIEFTGSGSEYFRIWIVNIFLLIITLGIYYPWAKVRRMRYFYGNTLVDGTPLGFHGNPRTMFKGSMLVGVLFGLYSAASNASPMAGLIALVIVAGIWPALLKSSMQFRMANTSWRGLRLSFTGTLGGAYAAAMPLFIPAILIIGLASFAPEDAAPKENMWLLWTMAGIMLLCIAITPWLLWNLKRYQHNNYALGSLQTTFKATALDFYKLSGKAIGVAVLSVLASGAVFWLIAFGLATSGGGNDSASLGIASVFGMGFGFFVGMAVVFVVLKPYTIAKIQNLVWTKTGNSSMRFISKLSVRALLWQTIKNWCLVVITLGLYWPFAAVAMARLRLESVFIKSNIDPLALFGAARVNEGDAAGDAAGDFFGIDMGL